MKRIGAVITAICCTLVLSSCSLIGSVIRSTDHFPDDIVHRTSDRMDQIVALLKQHDAKGLTALFSPKARADADDLDAALEAAFAVFDSDLDWASANNENPAEFRYSGSDGEYWKSFTPFCAVFDDGREYQIYFIEYYENTVDPDLVGLYSLRLHSYDGGCMYSDPAADFDLAEKVTSDPGSELPGIVVEDEYAS